MKYTPLTKKALRVAFDAHKDQIDKTGLPYVFHPFHLAEQFDDEESICVALLHDVVEDTDITINDLEKLGFTESIIEAIKLLTHDNNVEYMDYVKEIKKNPLAKRVKLADLKHNSDSSRLDVVDSYALEREKKYKKAIEYLLSE